MTQYRYRPLRAGKDRYDASDEMRGNHRRHAGGGIGRNDEQGDVL